MAGDHRGGDPALLRLLDRELPKQQSLHRAEDGAGIPNREQVCPCPEHRVDLFAREAAETPAMVHDHTVRAAPDGRKVAARETLVHGGQRARAGRFQTPRAHHVRYERVRVKARQLPLHVRGTRRVELVIDGQAVEHLHAALRNLVLR